jgi:sigma-B regulation protein RsbU (phosphoserine phosphatase)
VSSRPPVLRAVLLALLFVIACTYQWRITVNRYAELAQGMTLARMPFDPDLPEMTVMEPEAEAKAAGLTEGDHLLALDGHAIDGMEDLYPPIMRARKGAKVTFIVAKADGATHAATVTLASIRAAPPDLFDWATFLITGAAVPALCVGLGFWVAAVRIRDPLAWLLLLLFLSLSEFGGLSWRSNFSRLDWFHNIAAVYQPILSNFWPLSMFLLGIYFPDRLAFDRRRPWVKWIVLGPYLVYLATAIILVDVVELRHAALAVRLQDALGPFGIMGSLLAFVAITVFFAATGARRGMEKRQDAGRRLRLMHTGAFVAITPLLIAVVLQLAGIVDLSERAILLLLSLLFVFPLTMAYVIVVERALDVRLVVRQGVQYLLARGGVRVLQLVGSIAVFFLALDRFNIGGDSPLRFVSIAIGVAAIVAIGRFGDRLRRWVDRKFFREAYDAEQILAELANQVRTIVETQPLLETVGRQISSALHVPRLAILLNGGARLEPAYALGYADIRPVPLPSDVGGVSGDTALRAALDAELVLPLSANQKLVGVMGLGPKQSEEPFTSSDVRLLDAVATQTGLALENSRLTVQIAEEIADREKRKRELEIAREVQQRLFPQSYPPVPRLDYAGLCRPALEVGGDYYDFVPVPGGKFGIAVGDISGKGIPASLLMATLRAYLRGQTIAAAAVPSAHPLAAMVVNLNALVYESSATNRYATFFYAQYDPATRILDYVNAGHNPPMIFRGDKGAGGGGQGAAAELIRLDVGGPVVGLLPECAYEQGRVTLQPGDLFVSFTDGISEAMNSEMEEWGEERLIETVMPALLLPLDQLIARIMAGADAHTGTAPQHDNMTLVVARCV